jgi:hypothetical protein
MGCNFEWYNETKKEKSKNLPYYKLRRNIDRTSHAHLKRVCEDVIKYNNWSMTDTVIFDCCCEKYVWTNETVDNLHVDDFTFDPINDGPCECELCSSTYTGSFDHLICSSKPKQTIEPEPVYNKTTYKFTIEGLHLLSEDQYKRLFTEFFKGLHVVQNVNCSVKKTTFIFTSILKERAEIHVDLSCSFSSTDGKEDEQVQNMGKKLIDEVLESLILSLQYHGKNVEIITEKAPYYKVVLYSFNDDDLLNIKEN